MRALRIVVAAAVLAPAVCLTGCGDNQYETYCSTVKEHRADLSKLMEQKSGTPWLSALPILEDVRDDAPSDIAADWGTIISAIQGLKVALHEAGVDPTSYDPKHLPKSLTADEHAKIVAAASRMENQTTSKAAFDVQQQVRDVCHQPLTY